MDESGFQINRNKCQDQGNCRQVDFRSDVAYLTLYFLTIPEKKWSYAFPLVPKVPDQYTIPACTIKLRAVPENQQQW